MHNLRTILDHVVWELADEKAQGRHLPEFPIYDSPEGFHRSGMPKISTLPMEAKVLIEGFQPYQLGNEALSILQRLDNIDKHRRLITVPYAILSTTILASATGWRLTGGVTLYPGGRYQHGDVLLRCAGTNPVGQVKRVQIQPTYQVSVEDEGVSGEITATLTPLYDFVLDKVVRQFEPFFT